MDGIGVDGEVCVWGVRKWEGSVGGKEGRFRVEYGWGMGFGKGEGVRDREEKIEGVGVMSEGLVGKEMDGFDEGVERRVDGREVVGISLLRGGRGKGKEYEKNGDEMK